MKLDGALNELRRLMRLVRPQAQIHAIDYDPNDKRSCEQLAERMFREQNDFGELGTEARGRNLLRMIGDSYPIAPLAKAYFENLSALLEGRPKLSRPGRLLIGLGTGRSGSTTLASLLSGIPGACSTHENPPLVFWQPQPEQIEFHVRRFSMLLEHVALVSDCSHWWLNLVRDILARFPDSRFIGLVREPTACADSFMAIKKSGLGSYNHWVAFGNDVWTPSHWDPTYPTYEMPADSWQSPDRAKRDLILRYIHEYNVKLTALAADFPEGFLLVRTEELTLPSSLRLVSEFSGRRGKLLPTPLKLNARSVLDGREDKLRF